MFVKYYYLSLLFTLFTQCFGYIHLIERTLASFQEKPLRIKSCKNCKFFIENENNEFSRCSKFMKPKNRSRSIFGQEYRPPLVQHIKINRPDYYDENDRYSALLLFYLARTCRNNETMCGLEAKYYERKYLDIY
jgi:hypothetical protein